jgi:hypothetical protein
MVYVPDRSGSPHSVFGDVQFFAALAGLTGVCAVIGIAPRQTSTATCTNEIEAPDKLLIRSPLRMKHGANGTPASTPDRAFESAASGRRITRLCGSGHCG